MLFSSMIFLWVFLAAVIAVNFLFTLLPFKTERARIRTKNIFLLFASLFFYAWGGIYYLLIMVASILLNFAGGYVIERGVHTKAARRAALAVIVALNLAILFFFKYFNMLIAVIEAIITPDLTIGQTLGAIVNMEGTGALGLAAVVLPIGISFFTFQAMSYVLDVYMGTAGLQENILDFALYVSLFPQLIAGPIVRYSDVELQLRSRQESVDTFLSGQKRFCYGLAKKVIISNTVAEIANDIWSLETSNLGTAVAWLGILTYALQIYYDFSGYSDMAIGLGRMLGFDFKENFDYPYTSQSIQEFWQRWHMSLSGWFREYVYFPLGGSRKGKLRTYFNIFIVFFLTGLWHGANFTFIIWGIYFALIQIIERLFLGKLLKKNPVKIINWLYFVLAFSVSWPFFRGESVSHALEYLTEMFNFSSSTNSVFTYLSMRSIIVIIAGILFAGFIQRALKKHYDKIKNKLPVIIADYSFQLLTVIYSILLLVGGTYNPFIYFQF